MYYQKERNMIIFDADRPKDSQGELTGLEFTTDSWERNMAVLIF